MAPDPPQRDDELSVHFNSRYHADRSSPGACNVDSRARGDDLWRALTMLFEIGNVSRQP